MSFQILKLILINFLIQKLLILAEPRYKYFSKFLGNMLAVYESKFCSLYTVLRWNYSSSAVSWLVKNMKKNVYSELASPFAEFS